jgi:hypothetical protein
LKAGTGSTKCLVSSKICNVLQMVAERDRKWFVRWVENKEWEYIKRKIRVLTW